MLETLYLKTTPDLNVWHGRCAADVSFSDAIKNLTPADHARFVKLKPPEARRNFLGSRFMIRQFLQSAPLVSPPAVVRRTRAGQPYLEGQESIAVSWSRSGAELVIALSCGAQIGVDLERKRQMPCASMLAMICSRDELEAFGIASQECNQEDFFRIWTLKEAVLKCFGTGFQMPAKQLILPASVLTVAPGEAFQMVCAGRKFGVEIIETERTTLSLVRDITPRIAT